MIKNFTIAEVTEFCNNLNPNIVATPKGQEHLNRIGKAFTDESLKARVLTMRQTNAQKAFDKKVAEVATTNPDGLQALVARKEAWIATWIDRKYGTDED